MRSGAKDTVFEINGVGRLTIRLGYTQPTRGISVISTTLPRKNIQDPCKIGQDGFITRLVNEYLFSLPKIKKKT